MYIGRFLVVGKTENGKPFVSYRVSSRSFPNRKAVLKDNTVSIIPNDLNEIFSNPYITYNCIKVVDNTIIATNGSQTDVIADKIKLGLPIRDALAYSLITMDYEKDDYNTPRIAVVLNDSECYIGYVRHDGMGVEKVELENGKGYYIGVYNSCKISNNQIIDVVGEEPEEICKYIMEYNEFEHPVCCAAAVIDGGKIKIETL
ncbi:IMP cyclohydrolase [Methanothermococcus sp. Ax23]|jgi:IMP cyclohydrolase|uniref:IMP cyclohydrolase n=1 Tax=Methanothermococcus sp. Ax23 TaxID=3156486 RepID=UPI003B9EC004